MGLKPCFTISMIYRLDPLGNEVARFSPKYLINGDSAWQFWAAASAGDSGSPKFELGW